MEPLTLVSVLASVSALIAILFDKIKASRCTRIRSCCCDLERELEQKDREEGTNPPQ